MSIFGATVVPSDDDFLTFTLTTNNGQIMKLKGEIGLAILLIISYIIVVIVYQSLNAYISMYVHGIDEYSISYSLCVSPIGSRANTLQT